MPLAMDWHHLPYEGKSGVTSPVLLVGSGGRSAQGTHRDERDEGHEPPRKTQASSSQQRAWAAHAGGQSGTRLDRRCPERDQPRQDEPHLPQLRLVRLIRFDFDSI